MPRWWSVAVLFVALPLCFVIFVFIRRQPITKNIFTVDRSTDMALTLQRITEERNNASRQLNLLQVRLG